MKLKQKDLPQLVGKICTKTIGDFEVYLEILDVKRAYGHTRYLVKTSAGERWVEAVKINGEIVEINGA